MEDDVPGPGRPGLEPAPATPTPSPPSERRMIDTDIHVLIDPEQLLTYIEPGQREWFRSRGPGLGLPDYPWAHPVSWFRDDAEHAPGKAPTTSVGASQRQVLDAIRDRRRHPERRRRPRHPAHAQRIPRRGARACAQRLAARPLPRSGSASTRRNRLSRSGLASGRGGDPPLRRGQALRACAARGGL